MTFSSSLMAHQLEELRRGVLLRAALRCPGSLRDAAGHLDFDDESPTVFGTAYLERAIARQRVVHSLRPLLEERLRRLPRRAGGGGDHLAHRPEDHLACRDQSALDVD